MEISLAHVCDWDTDITALVLAYLLSKAKNVFISFKTNILLHKNVHMLFSINLSDMKVYK